MNNVFNVILQGIEALENYLDPPKLEEGAEGSATGNLGDIQPPPNPASTTEQPTPTPPPQIVWSKGKHGKDIHYDPAKDKVIKLAHFI